MTATRTVLLTRVLQKSGVCKKLLEIAHYLGAIHSWITSERFIVYIGGSECISEETLLTFRFLHWPITNILRTRLLRTSFEKIPLAEWIVPK